MEYKRIPTSEKKLLEMADNTYLVTAKDWIHADVMTFDAFDKVWYSPTDGSEAYPAPTHYMDIPKL